MIVLVVIIVVILVALLLSLLLQGNRHGMRGDCSGAHEQNQSQATEENQDAPAQLSHIYPPKSCPEFNGRVSAREIPVVQFVHEACSSQ